MFKNNQQLKLEKYQNYFPLLVEPDKDMVQVVVLTTFQIQQFEFVKFNNLPLVAVSL